MIAPSLLKVVDDGGDVVGATPAAGRLAFPFGVVLVSLLAVPVCFALSLTRAMEDARLVFLAGVLICTSIAVPTYVLIVRRGAASASDVYFYVFVVFAFTAVVDLLLALAIDGRLDWLHFYCREGEVYLTTAHGLWINYWDGTYHYACYLTMTAMMLRVGHSYTCPRFRTVALLWAGSILNSMIVLFVGSAVGLHAPHIKPSYLLNIPYALFPGVFLYRVLQARPEGKMSETGRNRKSACAWIIDIPLMALIFVTASLCIFRALVVLRSQLPAAAHYGTHIESHLLDSSAYPTIQMLTYAYLFVPYLVWSFVRVWRGFGSADGSNVPFIDGTKLAVGALLQGTFSYTLSAWREGGAYHSSERVSQTMESTPLAWFVVVNACLLATPILLLARATAAASANSNAKSAHKKE